MYNKQRRCDHGERIATIVAEGEARSSSSTQNESGIMQQRVRHQPNKPPSQAIARNLALPLRTLLIVSVVVGCGGVSLSGRSAIVLTAVHGRTCRRSIVGHVDVGGSRYDTWSHDHVHMRSVVGEVLEGGRGADEANMPGSAHILAQVFCDAFAATHTREGV